MPLYYLLQIALTMKESDTEENKFHHISVPLNETKSILYHMLNKLLLS